MALQRAARYYGKEDVRIQMILREPCGEGQVRIEPAFVGLCGTDLSEFTSGPTFGPTEPHPITKEKLPVGMGHEFSGIVREVGKGVTGISVGQKVAIQPTIYCSECGACKADAENACPNGGFIGLSGGGGGLSEDVVVPAVACVPVPDHVKLDIAALVEPLAVAWHAVAASPVAQEPNQQCLVLGGGPIGLAVVQVLLAKGAKKVIMSEVAAKRQQLAKQFGAHHVLDPRTFDLVAVSRELCGGMQGPDVVFDCAGVPASLKTACQAVKSRGTVINVAIWKQEVPFNPNWLVMKEARLGAVLGYQRRDFEGVIDAISKGLIKPERMITSKIPLGRVVEDGIKALIKNKDRHVKILVDMKMH
ncbi:GroES-like protein [Polychaeton citri CBS 116435]|uniref:GroES-like protein n=1 Tax=Polychaeton citri CBS 116435 TaxID=1314669 RepID=A0A9P4QCP4_9PEZI|nr:GroES-like protein [Polychaeton citri CBS 116435]